MVLLRLTVKIPPREVLGQKHGTSQHAGKSTSFLMVIRNPEQITLGELAWMITEKWRKFRPNAEPLEIKNLLDDKHDSDELDADLTVADVFVDNGKAAGDGLDQRSSVRVVQKPAQQRPVRYGSVAQDWNAITSRYSRPSAQKSKPPVPLFADTSHHNPDQPPLTTSQLDIHTRYQESKHQGSGYNNRIRDSPLEVAESEHPLCSIEEEEAELIESRRRGLLSPTLVEDSQPENTQGSRLLPAAADTPQSSPYNVSNFSRQNVSRRPTRASAPSNPALAMEIQTSLAAQQVALHPTTSPESNRNSKQWAQKIKAEPVPQSSIENMPDTITNPKENRSKRPRTMSDSWLDHSNTNEAQDEEWDVQARPPKRQRTKRAAVSLGVQPTMEPDFLRNQQESEGTMNSTGVGDKNSETAPKRLTRLRARKRSSGLSELGNSRASVGNPYEIKAPGETGLNSKNASHGSAKINNVNSGLHTDPMEIDTPPTPLETVVDDTPQEPVRPKSINVKQEPGKKDDGSNENAINGSIVSSRSNISGRTTCGNKESSSREAKAQDSTSPQTENTRSTISEEVETAEFIDLTETTPAPRSSQKGAPVGQMGLGITSSPPKKTRVERGDFSNAATENRRGESISSASSLAKSVRLNIPSASSSFNMISPSFKPVNDSEARMARARQNAETNTTPKSILSKAAISQGGSIKKKRTSILLPSSVHQQQDSLSVDGMEDMIKDSKKLNPDQPQIEVMEKILLNLKEWETAKENRDSRLSSMFRKRYMRAKQKLETMPEPKTATEDRESEEDYGSMDDETAVLLSERADSEQLRLSQSVSRRSSLAHSAVSSVNHGRSSLLKSSPLSQKKPFQSNRPEKSPLKSTSKGPSKSPSKGASESPSKNPTKSPLKSASDKGSVSCSGSSSDSASDGASESVSESPSESPSKNLKKSPLKSALDRGSVSCSGSSSDSASDGASESASESASKSLPVSPSIENLESSSSEDNASAAEDPDPHSVDEANSPSHETISSKGLAQSENSPPSPNLTKGSPISKLGSSVPPPVSESESESSDSTETKVSEMESEEEQEQESPGKRRVDGSQTGSSSDSERVSEEPDAEESAAVDADKFFKQKGKGAAIQTKKLSHDDSDDSDADSDTSSSSSGSDIPAHAKPEETFSPTGTTSPPSTKPHVRKLPPLGKPPNHFSKPIGSLNKKKPAAKKNGGPASSPANDGTTDKKSFMTFSQPAPTMHQRDPPSSESRITSSSTPKPQSQPQRRETLKSLISGYNPFGRR